LSYGRKRFVSNDLSRQRGRANHATTPCYYACRPLYEHYRAFPCGGQATQWFGHYSQAIRGRKDADLGPLRRVRHPARPSLPVAESPLRERGGRGNDRSPLLPTNRPTQLRNLG